MGDVDRGGDLLVRRWVVGNSLSVGRIRILSRRFAVRDKHKFTRDPALDGAFQ